jgi:hypothetical protein
MIRSFDYWSLSHKNIFHYFLNHKTHSRVGCSSCRLWEPGFDFSLSTLGFVKTELFEMHKMGGSHFDFGSPSMALGYNLVSSGLVAFKIDPDYNNSAMVRQGYCTF